MQKKDVSKFFHNSSMAVLEKEMSKLNTDGGFVMGIKTIFQLTIELTIFCRRDNPHSDATSGTK